MTNNQPIYFFTNPHMKRIAETHAPHLNISEHTGSIRSYVDIAQDFIFETPHVFASSTDEIRYKDIDYYNNSYAEHFSDDGDFDLNLYNEANFYGIHEYLSETDFLLENSITINLKINADASCRPFNPGTHISYGVIAKDDQGNIIDTDSGAFEYQGATNNIGEYISLQKAAELARKIPHNKVIFQMDSALIVQQVSGAWQCRQPHLKILLKQTMATLQTLQWEIRHVKRDFNQQADTLADEAYKKTFGNLCQ